jgi:hypothetical protein
LFPVFMVSWTFNCCLMLRVICFPFLISLEIPTLSTTVAMLAKSNEKMNKKLNKNFNFFLN